MVDGRVGPYRLAEVLHAGRVARTFLAVDESRGGGASEAGDGQRGERVSADRAASLKLLQPFADVEEQRLRLLREAELQELCAHPAVVAVRAAGRIERTAFIAREYVAGLTLGELRRRAAERGRFPPESVIAVIGDRLLQALEHMHGRRDAEGRPLGLVHRDVTPENVLIGWDGTVRLTDFGLAYAPALHGTLAEDEIAQGTRRHLPPESARGELPDARSDLFQLALTLAEVSGVALRGASPTWEELAEVDSRERVPPSLGPLGDVLAGALAPDRKDRHSSAAAMRAAWTAAGGAPPGAASLKDWLEVVDLRV